MQQTAPVVLAEMRAVVDRSAAPAAVGVALDRLVESQPQAGDRLHDDPALLEALVAVAGASRSLTDLCVTEPAALDVLAQLDRRPPLPAGGGPASDREHWAAVSRWKRLELLRIAARDLLGLDDLPAVGRGLAAMAADVLHVACATTGDAGLAVIGMGKLGGAELNYASDVDIVFVADQAAASERRARAVMDLARRCFRVDANLRPEGRDGPLARTLESYRAYWDRWAKTWEFQALIKARPAGGDPGLGEAFLESAQERLWSRVFSADDLRAVRSLKARSEDALARKGLSDRELKRGTGGIRDIEFAVQLLQLVHGGQDRAIRSPTTLNALAELGEAGYIDGEDARALDVAYRLLRTVEHRLQLVDEQQVHTLPTSEGAQDRLARVMGYRDTPEASARQSFLDHLRREQARVRAIHERLFFRPLLEVFTARHAVLGQPAAGAPPAAPVAAMSPEAAAARLAAFGFTDAERTRQALQELTRGLTRSSRLMQQMLPLVLGWLAESPDPDMGLLGLRRLADPHQGPHLAGAFRESPETARRLCLVLGTSSRLGQTLVHHPDLIPALGEPGGLDPAAPDALLEAARTSLAWRSSDEDRQRGLQRFKRREELRVAAADILDLAWPVEDPVAVAARQLTALAEAAVRAALACVDPPVPFAVIALGRFGGAELSYASDLDVMFVYDGGDAEFEAAEAAASALVRFLAGSTPAARVYEVDAGLRPEGRAGPLARSLDACAAYYARWAQTWELQALVRARFVAGDAEVGRRFLDLVEPFVWRHPFPEEDVREIRRMKARVERERLPAGDDPAFHLKLGRGSLSDVEFTAQLLQLQHRVPATGTIEALDALAGAGALDRADRDVLTEAYRFCERTRNRWFWIKGAPGDALPVQAEQLARLARSLDTTPTELREQYRRVTRRARQVVERVFYGKSA